MAGWSEGVKGAIAIGRYFCRAKGVRFIGKGGGWFNCSGIPSYLGLKEKSMPGLSQCRWLMNSPERRQYMELYKAAGDKHAEYYT